MTEFEGLRDRWRRFLEDDCLDLMHGYQRGREIDPERVLLPTDPEVTGRWPASAWTKGPCWDLVAALRQWLGDSKCAAIVVELMPVGIQIHGVVRVNGWCVDGVGFHSLDEVHDRWVGELGAGCGPRYHRMRAIEWDDDEFWGWGHLLVPPHSALSETLVERMRRHLDPERFLAALASVPAAPATRAVVALAWDEEPSGEEAGLG